MDNQLMHKDYAQHELCELYAEAMKDDRLIVVRLIHQIYLLQDFLADEKEAHNRTRNTLHELRAQYKYREE